MPETTHGLEAVGLDEEILVLSPSDEFDLGERSLTDLQMATDRERAKMVLELEPFVA